MEFSSRFRRMEAFIQGLQENICRALDKVGRTSYLEDTWERPGGGGGRTRVYTDGLFLEKGGVNISSVYGELTKDLAQAMHLAPGPFAACGLSLVLHPYSPRIPTVHANIRYFELASKEPSPQRLPRGVVEASSGSGGEPSAPKESWYGGGLDLTPYVPLVDDFIHFHQQLKTCCEAAIPGSYPGFKAGCDDYFTVGHRQEMRGIGGVFFDYLKDDLDEKEALVTSLGEGFAEAYLPIVTKRMGEPFTQEEKRFQLMRRGRYVEFNLLYDRGTLFGLKSGGRIESILMSLPPTVAFPYNWKPQHDFEKEMLQYYQPRDWVGG